MAKKLYYKIGEACKILDIQPYVLRYWEKEFPLLSPNKSKSGQRVYSERELAMIRRIKELLYEEGYTIAGAKKKLEAEMADARADARTADAESADARSAVREETAAPSAAGVKPSRATAERRRSVRARAARTPEVDTGTAEEIVKLRSGVEEALAEAREILTMLEPTPGG